MYPGKSQAEATPPDTFIPSLVKIGRMRCQCFGGPSQHHGESASRTLVLAATGGSLPSSIWLAVHNFGRQCCFCASKASSAQTCPMRPCQFKVISQCFCWRCNSPINFMRIHGTGGAAIYEWHNMYLRLMQMRYRSPRLSCFSVSCIYPDHRSRTRMETSNRQWQC